VGRANRLQVARAGINDPSRVARLASKVCHFAEKVLGPSGPLFAHSIGRKIGKRCRCAVSHIFRTNHSHVVSFVKPNRDSCTLQPASKKSSSGGCLRSRDSRNFQKFFCWIFRGISILKFLQSSLGWPVAGCHGGSTIRQDSEGALISRIVDHAFSQCRRLRARVSFIKTSAAVECRTLTGCSGIM